MESQGSLLEGERGSESVIGDATTAAEVGVMCSEDGGSGRKPRNVGGH